jgi:hypothetical protein
MPAAVPAIPPNPKIAAMIAITKNVNAQLSMIQLRPPPSPLNEVCPYSDWSQVSTKGKSSRPAAIQQNVLPSSQMFVLEDPQSIPTLSREQFELKNAA